MYDTSLIIGAVSVHDLCYSSRLHAFGLWNVLLYNPCTLPPICLQYTAVREISKPSLIIIATPFITRFDQAVVQAVYDRHATMIPYPLLGDVLRMRAVKVQQFRVSAGGRELHGYRGCVILVQQHYKVDM